MVIFLLAENEEKICTYSLVHNYDILITAENRPCLTTQEKEFSDMTKLNRDLREQIYTCFCLSLNKVTIHSYK